MASQDGVAQRIRLVSTTMTSGSSNKQSDIIKGFALFFATFDVSRHAAVHVSRMLASTDNIEQNNWDPFSGIGRFAQSLVLVGGGVVGGIGHELVGRPFDTARRILYIHDAHSRAESTKQSQNQSYSNTSADLSRHNTFRSKVTTSISIIRETAREEGLLSFFQSPNPTSFDSKSSPYQRLQTALRTLGRVGPWGIAFVVWEATGGVST
jgi:hypothetical protein